LNSYCVLSLNSSFLRQNRCVSCLLVNLLVCNGCWSAEDLPVAEQTSTRTNTNTPLVDPPNRPTSPHNTLVHYAPHNILDTTAPEPSHPGESGDRTQQHQFENIVEGCLGGSSTGEVPTNLEVEPHTTTPREGVASPEKQAVGHKRGTSLSQEALHKAHTLQAVGSDSNGSTRVATQNKVSIKSWYGTMHCCFRDHSSGLMCS
jgi:hypothetical protein